MQFWEIHKPIIIILWRSSIYCLWVCLKKIWMMINLFSIRVYGLSWVLFWLPLQNWISCLQSIVDLHALSDWASWLYFLKKRTPCHYPPSSHSLCGASCRRFRNYQLYIFQFLLQYQLSSLEYLYPLIRTYSKIPDNWNRLPCFICCKLIEVSCY